MKTSSSTGDIGWLGISQYAIKNIKHEKGWEGVGVHKYVEDWHSMIVSNCGRVYAALSVAGQGYKIYKSRAGLRCLLIWLIQFNDDINDFLSYWTLNASKSKSYHIWYMIYVNSGEVTIIVWLSKSREWSQPLYHNK